MNGSQISPKAVEAKAETGRYLTTNSSLAPARGGIEFFSGWLGWLQGVRHAGILVL
jgi:hypothetical protein